MLKKKCIFVDMKKWVCLLTFLAFCQMGKAQAIEVLDMSSYQNRVMLPNDSLYVVNFWATWCKPCVQELPYFLQMKEKYTQQKVVFVFINLNSLKEIEKVETFVKDKHLPLPSYLLQAGNPTVWIDQVEKEWSGSIPFTLFYQGGRKLFFKEGEFEMSELENKLKDYL